MYDDDPTKYSAEATISDLNTNLDRELKSVVDWTVTLTLSLKPPVF